MLVVFWTFTYLPKIEMASCLPKVSHCQICFEETKYICITCGIPICNKCGIPELDEDVRGWLASRRVGYCTVNCLQPPQINETSGSQDILSRFVTLFS